MRRIGILWPYRSRITSLLQGLRDLGWIEGRNLRFDYRWGASADDPDRIRRYAIELVALAPDVIVAGSGGIAVELKRTSRTVPIVFPTANDPVGFGLVESLARPGGNATGFSGFDSARTDKFPELLKRIAPSLTRVAVIANPNPTRGGGNASLGAIEAAAAPLGIKVSPIDLRDVDAHYVSLSKKDWPKTYLEAKARMKAGLGIAIKKLVDAQQRQQRRLPIGKRATG
jgi:putative ABC transport system substrate-binding protein